MLYRAIPFLVLLAALVLGCRYRASPVARGLAIIIILAVATFPFLGIVASHRLATVRYVDSVHQAPSEEYRAGAIAARGAAHEQLPLLSGIIIVLAVLAMLPLSSRRGASSTRNDRNA